MQAWAKHHGCYETVESGQTDDAMAYLTGSDGPTGSRTCPTAQCRRSAVRTGAGPRAVLGHCQGCLRRSASYAVPWMRQLSRACAG